MTNPANPNRDPITDKDLAKFVANDSDFAFEMRVVAELKGAKFECSHSGSYQDPVTEKIRQFDVRACKEQITDVLSLAVECKNLRPESPLLLSCIPRIAKEAYHEVILHPPNSPLYKKVLRVEGDQSVYKPAEMVGKKTDQVKRDKNAVLVSDDKDTFDKVNQAVHSCKDLVTRLVNSHEAELFGVVVPVLVLPKNTLWQVEYEGDGTLRADPHRVTHATLFLDHAWSVDRGLYGTFSYHLTHVEFITIDALHEIVSAWLGPHGFFAGAH
jgi:hypothetical protein